MEETLTFHSQPTVNQEICDPDPGSERTPKHTRTLPQKLHPDKGHSLLRHPPFFFSF